MGSRAQLSVQLNLFIPTYYKSCPNANGTVTYQAATESAAALAVQQHSQGADPDNFPWLYYASDLPLSLDEYSYAYTDVSHIISKPAPLSNINHFPIMLNGFAIGYNLAGCSLTSPLKITNEELGLIYSGIYTRWSQLAPNNPELLSCSLPIRVSARLDEAASSTVLKDFISTAMPTFNVYKQKKLNTIWPSTLTVACLGTGEAGMGSCLLTPGSIGYIEYREAKARNLPMAQVANASKAMVHPASSSSSPWPDNCGAAAEATTTPFSSMDSSWTSFTLTGTRAGYPLCAYSYVLVFNDLSRSYGGAMTTGRARNLVDYLLSKSSPAVQGRLPEFGYGPIPAGVRETVRAGIDGINF